MRTSIIFISLLLTTAFCREGSILSVENTTNEEKERYSPKVCYPKIIGAYGPEIDQYERRSSMIPSELIASVCQNVNDSCCLDKEFSEMYTQALAKSALLVRFRDQIMRSINIVSSWNKADKDKLMTQIQNWEDMSFEKNTFLSVIDELKTNRKTIREDVRAAFRVIFENSGGLPCAICEAKNHTNFVNMESRDEFKMVVDVNMCENMFNNPDFAKLIDFTTQISKFEYINQILQTIYKISFETQNLENQEEAESKMETLRQSCLASQDAFINNNTCLEFCFETGKFNENMSSIWIHPFVTFNTLAEDFFGDQKMFKSLLETEQETSIETPNHTPEEDQIIENPREVIRKDVELMTFKYFLDPANENQNEINLNNVHFETRKGDGWNLNEVRVKEYPRQESAWVFGFMINLVGVIMFMFN